MQTKNVFKIILSALSAVLFCCAIFAVFAQAAEDKIKVVTTTSDLKAIAEFVGGDKAEVFSISTGYQNPHFVDAKPSYMIKARNADLFIRIGLELELAWESSIIGESRNSKIKIGSPGHLDVSQGIEPLEIPIGSIDRSMGDIHPSGNPHYWLDPINAKLIADNIAKRLAIISPENENYFMQNSAQFSHLIDEKMDGWLSKMVLFKGKKILAYHKSWPYFAKRFGLIIAGELEPRPGIPPTSRHLLELIKKIESEHIDVILMEPFYSDKPARFIASKTNVQIVKAASSVGGVKGGDDYFSLIDSIVDNLVLAFEAAGAK